MGLSNNKPSQQTWNASHGIVFSGQNRTTSSPHRSTARSFGTQSAAEVAPSISSLLDAGAAPAGSDGTAYVTTTIREEVKEEVTEEIKVEPEEDDDAPPPFTPLDFKIPEEKFRTVKKAEEGTPGSYWNYNLYSRPGEDGETVQKIKVHYCTSGPTTERTLKQYFANEKVLGFDLEWDPDGWKVPQNARRNVSVVQIASESRIGVFHLALYPKNEPLVTPLLRKIMEDPEVTKLGVCIKGDAWRMKQYLKIQPRGIFELSHLYKLVRYSASGEYYEVNKKLVSLANQVKDVLGLPLFKGNHVRSSDWSKKLTMEQIIYGASDAYAAVQIYAVLNHQREQLDPVPPLPGHAELDLPIRLAEGIKVSPRPKVVLEAEEVSPDGFTPDTTETKTKSSKPPPKTKKPLDPRIDEASLWASQYRIANPEPAIPPACLRSYYTWHKNPDLDPAAIAALLRDPPLQTMTVVMYIAEVLCKTKLPCDVGRIRKEILPWFKGQFIGTRGKRHLSLIKLCEDLEMGVRTPEEEEEIVEVKVEAKTVEVNMGEETAEVEVTEKTVKLKSKVKVLKEEEE
ncbi:putative Werner syndrome helicase [Podospora fimiseda]|uniref:Werner syndrome helicase n=1 Tax=Podospora fimiseda TaxID=252190 RepID=A0AAN7BUS8_9PEZI|nr:putative Werner syndrome helicase [Podospora fimiseda]